MKKKAIVAGASGLIGSNLLEILLQRPDYEEVVALVRKELPVHHKKLRQIIVNFDELNTHIDDINGDVIFCCLGSTRAKTPDLAMYKKVDHDYPVTLAQLAQQNQVKQFHLVSAIGANAASRSFYLKLKGETENDVATIGLHTLYIYQPSFLTGKRPERRLMETTALTIMKVIDPLLFGTLRKYRSIAAKIVAQAMFNKSLINNKGVFIYPSDIIKQLA